ncbi:MAG: ribosome biogenesis protein [Candidatus Aenigmarchaeota archaeon]|nr:ribosome biogenesis protein [Candidatus Aenigmarchaeota archaeon]
MRLRKCPKCSSYSLKHVCCGSATVSPHPAKYHPARAAYLRLAKKLEHKTD